MMQVNEWEMINTTSSDWDMVMQLFQNAMALQGKNGYKVWQDIDEAGLRKDIENKLQYKILQDGNVLCIFSVQFNDPFILQERDKSDAIYLHRIVANTDFKGQKQFEKVLNWAKEFARQNNLKYIRMDTWADNAKTITYYQSFGFELVGKRKTGDEPGLPIQNRNIESVLLELEINSK